jgi:hypothetical protein
MQHSTPFFQGFSSVLFGRPALSGLQEKLREVAALNTLSDFFATFGFLIPDALLRRRSSGANSRQRRFTLHVTFWAFLAQTLSPRKLPAATSSARCRPGGCCARRNPIIGVRCRILTFNLITCHWGQVSHLIIGVRCRILTFNLIT